MLHNIYLYKYIDVDSGFFKDLHCTIMYNVLLICTGTFIFRVIYQVYIFLLKHVHVQGISLGWTLNNKKVGDRDIYVNGHIYFNISCELVAIGTYILVSKYLFINYKGNMDVYNLILIRTFRYQVWNNW